MLWLRENFLPKLVLYSVEKVLAQTDSLKSGASLPDSPAVSSHAGDSSVENTAAAARDSVSAKGRKTEQYLIRQSIETVPGYLNGKSLEDAGARNAFVHPGDTLPSFAFMVERFHKLTTGPYEGILVKKKYVPSVFASHELTCNKIAPRFLSKEKNDGLLLLFILLAGIVGAVQYFYKKRFNMLTKALFIERFASQMVREENILTQRIALLLNSVFIGIFAFFVYFTARQFGDPTLTFSSYWLILLFCGIFFGSKYLLNRLIGFLFLVEKEIKEFVFNYFLVLQFLGIVLVFTAYWAVFSGIGRHWAIYFAWGLFVLAWMYQFFRGVRITSGNKRISKLYLFCYLCTLEILPVLLLVGFLRKE